MAPTTSNFGQFPPEYRSLVAPALEAELHLRQVPGHAAVQCRNSLEKWVRWMYQHDADLIPPADATLHNLLNTTEFRQLVGQQFQTLDTIRRLGNQAAHGTAPTTAQEALHTLKLVYGFAAWAVELYSPDGTRLPRFNEALIPDPAQQAALSAQQLKAAQDEVEAKKAEIEKLSDELAATVAAHKARNRARVPNPADPDEALTRQLYVDVLLREAGWNPRGPNVHEYPLADIEKSDGTRGSGKADYVLWAPDGLPLGVVEAKRVHLSAEAGQHQAQRYADALEKKFGQRPVIFYTNGHETWLWDDAAGYPPRKVYGFYSQQELLAIIHRRTNRQSLTTETINTSIVERPYQYEALRRVFEAFEAQKRRGALLVMATGTGKTRTAAALIDHLVKAGWVKRVLFLADRLALVDQAFQALKTHLPHLAPVNLTEEEVNEGSRLVFSTYQTILNRIDKDRDGDRRLFGPGRFDLVIFDEVHRTIYNKYRHVFHYFDGLRVGLTATPKADTHRDTYALFGLRPQDPTFAYELEQAVKDGYLVDYAQVPMQTQFLSEGIRYADLSEEDKEQYELHFADEETGELPGSIEPQALNEWLFNADTINKILAGVMEHGVKVDGGDKLGKTIIFARSHKHAIEIQRHFNTQYPIYGGKFLKVIDNYEPDAKRLLENFKDPAKLPQIAVSVEMLDTGIDVPEIVNLVLFKPVRSITKFWQMLGRGTRLSPGLFGPGKDKTQFVVFDCCRNFEFFSQNPRVAAPSDTKSLSHRLFETRFRLAHALAASTSPELEAYSKELTQHLVRQTQEMSYDNIIVRNAWEQVSKYQNPQCWDSLSEAEQRAVLTHIAPLATEQDTDVTAKRFDALVLDIELKCTTQSAALPQSLEALSHLAKLLSRQAHIPQVGAKINTVRQAMALNGQSEVNITDLETIRTDLRGLVRYIDYEVRETIYTDFEDNLTVELVQREMPQSVLLDAYKERIQSGIKGMEEHYIIQQLKKGLPISRFDFEYLENLLTFQGNIKDRALFAEALGHQPLGKFIRTIIGMDRQAVQSAFAEFLKTRCFNSNQMEFIKLIIASFESNGVVTMDDLFESPFTSIHFSGVAGLFSESERESIQAILESLNYSAEAA